jgi:hypothetical protein
MIDTAIMEEPASAPKTAVFSPIQTKTGTTPAMVGRSVAGYQKVLMQHFWAEARRVLESKNDWPNVRDSKPFLHMLEKQKGESRNTFMFDMCSAHRPAQDRASELLVEIVAMALCEIQKDLDKNNMTNGVMSETAHGIHRIIDKSISEEEALRQKAVSSAIKTAGYRTKILAMKEQKQQLIEEKREFALSQTRESPLVIKTRQMKAMGEEKAKEIIAHQLKQNERTKERLDRLKGAVAEKEKHHIEVEKRREEQTRLEQEEKKREAADHFARVQGGAADDDDRFRQDTLRKLEQKEERFNKRHGSFLAGRDKHAQDGKDKYNLLSFRAEQRRRMQKEERDKQLEMVAIRHEKLEASMKLKNAIMSQRRQILHKVATDYLPHTGDAPLEVTPGPGDYEAGPAKSIRGGRISTSGAISSKITPAAPLPGPGHYSPKMADLAKGATPFSGRGKTYVDELIVREKKLPGPGQYNFSSKKVSGGKISSAFVPTQVDELVRSRRGMPGPGYYELDKPPPSPLRPLLKSFGEEALAFQYPDVVR